MAILGKKGDSVVGVIETTKTVEKDQIQPNGLNSVFQLFRKNVEEFFNHTVTGECKIHGQVELTEFRVGGIGGMVCVKCLAVEQRRLFDAQTKTER